MVILLVVDVWQEVSERAWRAIDAALGYADQPPLRDGEKKTLSSPEFFEDFDDAPDSVIESAVRRVLQRRRDERAKLNATRFQSEKSPYLSDKRHRWLAAKSLMSANFARGWGRLVAAPSTRVGSKSFKSWADNDETAHMVQQFRWTYLGGDTIDPDAFEAWKAEHNWGRWDFFYDAAEKMAFWFGWPIHEAKKMVAENLVAAYSDDGELAAWASNEDDAGWELRKLAQVLAERLRWTEHAAAEFVLCDTVPIVGVATAAAREKYNGWAVEMSVDVDLTPDEVAEVYQRERDRFLRSRTQPPPTLSKAERAAWNKRQVRSRPVKEESLDLLLWAEQHEHRGDIGALYEAAKALPEFAEVTTSKATFRRRLVNAGRRVLHGQ